MCSVSKGSCPPSHQHRALTSQGTEKDGGVRVRASVATGRSEGQDQKTNAGQGKRLVCFPPLAGPWVQLLPQARMTDGPAGKVTVAGQLCV